ncbi:MAG: cohesin domain-containing protein [Bacillota bacterium]
MGDIVKATLRIENIDDFSGYQINIKYDPSVLQPVDVNTGLPFTERTSPVNGTLLADPGYQVVEFANNNLNSGILNFGKYSAYLDDEITQFTPEDTGILGVIGFKVLQAKDTSIRFEDTPLMSDAIEGTILCDGSGYMVDFYYKVVQPDTIRASGIPPTPSFTYGDTDGDGIVGANDYALIRDYVIEKITVFPSSHGLTAADVDGDGIISSNDAALVRDRAIDKIGLFPAEK